MKHSTSIASLMDIDSTEPNTNDSSAGQTPVMCSSALDCFIMTLPTVEDYGASPDLDAMTYSFDHEGVSECSLAASGLEDSLHSSNKTAINNRQSKTDEDSSSITSPITMSCSDSKLLQRSSCGPLLVPSTVSGQTMPTLSAATTVASNNHVPEFLFQLTKMLTDDNREIIEWSKGRIEVHSPKKLESRVLNNYFRHSKFASFQRQLNYFGFRKLAGKGKMAPCSYINDAASQELSSLLCIRRKAGATTGVRKKEGSTAASGSPSRSKFTKKNHSSATGSSDENPILVDMLHEDRTEFGAAAQSRHSGLSIQPTGAAAVTRSSQNPSTPVSSVTIDSSTNYDDPHRVLARQAVGHGVRHGYVMSNFLQSNRSLPSPSPVPSLSSPRSLSVPNEVKMCQDMETTTEMTVGGDYDDDNFEDSFFETLEPPVSLSQLESKFRNSLNDLRGADDLLTDPTPLNAMRVNSPSLDATVELDHFLPRDSSLVDLAMIPQVEDSLPPVAAYIDSSMPNDGLFFADFSDTNELKIIKEQIDEVDDSADEEAGNYF